MTKAPSRLVAILGPTNTGKTHMAVERMQLHATGMMGFPLRLLARENYDRLCAKIGSAHVALVTGEERITPPNPRYWICTVEAMPVSREVEFVAVDEVQLAADYERGHSFTDRILNLRGKSETVFVGAETIAPILLELFPDIEVIRRERFSQLSYAGYKKMTRLPPRSAIVAFSADDVYRLAEIVRQRHGGAAVVLGALSPRTRNAQVGMYQAGEVDYLVATDAIGMGLNMDINHVAFSRLNKYDGRVHRPLIAAEIAQIAGRAGRHTTNGTFGCTEAVSEIPQELAVAVENNDFQPLPFLMWRNSDLDFSSPEALKHSLERKPPKDFLFRPQNAEDTDALNAMLQDNVIHSRLSGTAELFTLWEVCQIPDFEKLLSESYLRFIKQLYLNLTYSDGLLPEEWVREQVERIDRTDGDIDTLTTRLGRIRTWTYIANRGDWLKDSAYWRGQTRAIEDRLSDALHERLTERFVETRAGVNPRGKLFCYVDANNTVTIDGKRIGWFNGFRFNPDHEAKTFFEVREVMRTIRPALHHEAMRRAQVLAQAESKDITFNTKGELIWNRAVVGKISRGKSLLKPSATVIREDWLDGEALQLVEKRLHLRVLEWLTETIAPLLALSHKDLTPPARGVAFQLLESLGCMQREAVVTLIGQFTKEDRIAFGACGVHLGSALVWIDRLWTPEAMRARAILWAVWNKHPIPPPPQGKSVPVGDLPKSAWHAIGYSVFAGRAVRADIVEEFIPLLHQVPAPPVANLVRNLGVQESEFSRVLHALGYVIFKQQGITRYVKPKRDKKEEPPPLNAAEAIDLLKNAWGV